MTAGAMQAAHGAQGRHGDVKAAADACGAGWRWRRWNLKRAEYALRSKYGCPFHGMDAGQREYVAGTTTVGKIAHAA